jgi:hypothetical protein
VSLQTLRDMRLARLRPAAVTLVLRDCPKPWPWLRDDPAVVWLPQRADVDPTTCGRWWACRSPPWLTTSPGVPTRCARL